MAFTKQTLISTFNIEMYLTYLRVFINCEE